MVFGRPIGQNQAIQHPLAESWMELEAADLMMLKAAALYDAGRPCGAEANAAKYLGAEAGFTACTRAVMTHGGYGYAKEFHVERYLREAMIARLAPVSRELILCYIAERELGLPKSYSRLYAAPATVAPRRKMLDPSEEAVRPQVTSGEFIDAFEGQGRRHHRGGAGYRLGLRRALQGGRRQADALRHQ